MKTVGILILGKKGLAAFQFIEKKAPMLLRKISFVVIGTDPNVQDDYYEQINAFCKKNALKSFQRDEFPGNMPECEWLITIGWKWLIDTKKYKVVVIHDSLLPKYRGFNPLVTALIEGDEQIGVTAIVANEKMDGGAIICQKSSSVKYPIKIRTAIEKVSRLYGEILLDLLSENLNNSVRIPQNEDHATYSLWRNERDYQIDWNQSSNRIRRFIDAVGFPYLGALTHYKNEPIRIREAEEVEDINIINRDPGKLFSIQNNCPLVVCGKGIIRIDSVQHENGSSFEFKSLRVRLE